MVCGKSIIHSLLILGFFLESFAGLLAVNIPNACKLDNGQQIFNKNDAYRGYKLKTPSQISGTPGSPCVFTVEASRLLHHRAIQLSIDSNKEGITGEGKIPKGLNTGKMTLQIPASVKGSTLDLTLQGNDGVMKAQKYSFRLQIKSDPFIFGLTVEYPNGDETQGLKMEAQLEALRQLQCKNLMTRLVFHVDWEDEADPSKPQKIKDNAEDYLAATRKYAKIGNIMGCFLDSDEMGSLTIDQVRARAKNYIATMGDLVSVWEVGNEINGDWLGASENPAENKKPKPSMNPQWLSRVPLAKSYEIYREVKLAKKKTALTLYFARDFAKTGDEKGSDNKVGFDMMRWVRDQIPESMREGLDYVLVSYYESENENGIMKKPEMDAIFRELRSIFKNAKLGFGECGYPNPDEETPSDPSPKPPPTPSPTPIPKPPKNNHIPADPKLRAELLKRYYSYRPPGSVSGYIGGCFYWNFGETMVAPGPIKYPYQGTDDWKALKALMK